MGAEYVASGKGNGSSVDLATPLGSETDLYVIIAYGNAAPDSAGNPNPSGWTSIYYYDRGGGNGSYNGATHRFFDGVAVSNPSFPRTQGYAWMAFRNAEGLAESDSAETYVGAMNPSSWTASTNAVAGRDVWLLVDSDIDGTYAPQTPSGWTAPQRHDNAAGSAGVLYKVSTTTTDTDNPGQCASNSLRGATCQLLLTGKNLGGGWGAFI